MSTNSRTVIGSNNNFWLHSATDGYDLTHPPTPSSPLIYPHVTLQTTTSKVTVDPAKTALVVVDMQNFFLSPALGRPKGSKGLQACEQLLQHAIPASRKAGIAVVWLNWGLTQDDIDNMPPATLKAFGFTGTPLVPSVPEHGNSVAAGDKHGVNGDAQSKENLNRQSTRTNFGRSPSLYRGLGTEIGPVELEDGTVVDGGKILCRDQWNSALYAPLEDSRPKGMDGASQRKDVLIHKDRMSGLWGSGTLLTNYLDSQGIRTLIFAGVNTDQCVGGSLQDAFTKGYDCLLLSDGCATTTPDANGGQAAVEYNTARTWGFLLSCKDLEDGVQNLRAV